MSRYFITSTGTEIGKTLVTAALCNQLQKSGRQVRALKPLISGYVQGDAGSDSAVLLAALGQEQSEANIAAISPWRFAAALAPSMAAKLEGRSIALDEVVAFCQAQKDEVLLAEGAGGIMAPINEQHTMLDWMVALSWPVVLVAGSYLGSISHTLTALEVLRARGLIVQAVVLSETAQSSVTLAQTAAELARFVPAGVPIIKIPRIDAQYAIAEHVPPLTGLIRELV